VSLAERDAIATAQGGGQATRLSPARFEAGTRTAGRTYFRQSARIAAEALSAIHDSCFDGTRTNGLFYDQFIKHYTDFRSERVTGAGVAGRAKGP